MLNTDFLSPALLQEIATKYGGAAEVEAIRINFEGITTFNGDMLCELSAQYPLLDFETEGTTILLIKPMPNFFDNQSKLTRLLIKLGMWNEIKNNQKGELLDSGGSVQFIEGSVKMPDITYILRTKLADQPKEKVILIVPDFVVEYVSTYDSLKEAKRKMEFYMERGIALGWLIVPKEQQTYVYKPDEVVRTVHFQDELTGENVLPDFRVVLAELFES